MNILYALSCCLLVSIVSCSTAEHDHGSFEVALIDSEEVEIYDQSVRDKNPSDFLMMHERRLNEPYVIAGEKDQRLELMTLSLIKLLGDDNFAAELRNLSERQAAAVAVFVTTKDLGEKYPETRKYLNSVRGRYQFQAVDTSRREGLYIY